MVVSTTDYGTFKTHTGTLAEVAGAIKGKQATNIMFFFYSAGDSIYVVIEKS